MSNTIHPDNIVQRQTVSEAVLTAGTVVETVRLSNRLADAEKAQFLDWFEERYSEPSDVVGTVSELIQAMSHGLAGELSAETIQSLISLLKTLSS